jgi:hypothetical protein
VRLPSRDQHNRPNSGAKQHSASRSHNPTVVYEIDGEVRWLDEELQRVVVHVADANGHAGALRGKDVTFGVAGARVTGGDVNADGSRDGADLLPGVRVRVRARLPRSLDGGVPDLITAASVGMLPAPVT